MPKKQSRLLIAGLVAISILAGSLLLGGGHWRQSSAQPARAESDQQLTKHARIRARRRSRHRTPLLVGRDVHYAYHRAAAAAGGARFPQNPTACKPFRLKGRVFDQDPRPDALIGRHTPIRIATNYTASCGKSTPVGPACSPSQIGLSMDVHYISAHYYAKIEVPGIPEDTDQISLFIENTGSTPCRLEATAKLSIEDPATGRVIPIDANPSRIELDWTMRPGHHLVGYMEWDSWCYGRSDANFVLSMPGAASATEQTRTPACGYLRERPLLSGTYVYEL